MTSVPLTVYTLVGGWRAELIGVMDFFQCAFVVLAWLYLRRKETKAAKDNDFNTATASDYTVMVRTHHKYYDSKLLDGLLRDHFKELLGHDAVADINFGFNNSMAIDTLRLRGEFMLKLDRINRLILADMNKKHMELPAELRRNTFKAHAKKLKLLASYERVLVRRCCRGCLCLATSAWADTAPAPGST